MLDQMLLQQQILAASTFETMFLGRVSCMPTRRLTSANGKEMPLLNPSDSDLRIIEAYLDCH
jgi:hypothetical protein